MSERGLLQLEGAQLNRQSRFHAITTQKFFSGLWTQTSPFNGPDSRYAAQLGGRPDLLIDGLNVELTNYGTVIRRPGFSEFSSALLPATILSFYSFRQLNTTIILLADTESGVYVFTPTTATLLYTKSSTAQIFFQTVGNTVYASNGTDMFKWNGSQITAPAVPVLSAVVSGALAGET